MSHRWSGVRLAAGAVAAVAAAALAAGTAACAGIVGTGGMAEVMPAQDTPVRFVTADEGVAGQGCRVMMLDPRDQTQLRLARSAQFGLTHHGDYEVPAGRYGVQRNELLRLDCATGEVVGIVRL
jgi:hypothetical protein